MSVIKNITSSVHDYTIRFEETIDFLGEVINDPAAIYIVDEQVFNIYNGQFSNLKNSERLILLTAVEENKTLAAAEHVYDKIIELKPTKKTKIVSIGGGITQDVSGFVASTFYRGLKWTYVPTTLLAQADSCMGSKTSLNYKSYKNILGTFYPPHEIFISAAFTATLKEEDYYSGLGEVAKLHTMGGIKTLDYLFSILSGIHSREAFVITAATKSSLDIKWTYMEHDEFDQGIRNMLNFGHEYGHAIETATNYTIPHGQAVIIGMIMANDVAVRKGQLSVQLNDRLNTMYFSMLRCNYKQLGTIDTQLIIGAMKQDKKRSGSGLPLIMMNNDFVFSKITDLTESEALDSLTYFQNTYCR